jgi:Collagen triple helix repeat (20 copies)
MFSLLRNRFGIPGVISVIALTFAMFGGAYAASDNGGGKATASAKKGPRGPKGPKGPKGDAGPAGPAGPQGPAGANGKDGANGANGATGGTGPTGATGATGATGSSGFTATLPSGETETGSWAFGNTVAGQSEVYVPISFAIPLADELDFSAVHYIQASTGEEIIAVFNVETLEFEYIEQPPTQCLGSAAEPTATSGNLCVYGRTLINAVAASSFIRQSASNAGEPGVSTAGAYLRIAEAEAGAHGFGTWAVTG